MGEPVSRRPLSHQLSHGLRTSIRNNASAFGYSIAVTLAFSLAHEKNRPFGLGGALLFVLGASVSFVLLEALASHGFRLRMRGDPPEVVAVGSAFSLLSIGLSSIG